MEGDYIFYGLLILFVEAEVILPQILGLARINEVFEFHYGCLDLTVAQVFGEAVFEAHFWMLEQEQVIDELKVNVHFFVKLFVQKLCQFGVAV